MDNAPVIITISRLLGSGGSRVGRQLSKKLHYNFIDKHIVADIVSKMDDESFDKRNERKYIWDKVAGSYIYGDVDAYINSIHRAFIESEIYHAEEEVIDNLISDQSSVLVGRSGFHLMRAHERHISLFIYADLETRIKNIQSLSTKNISEKEARDLIESVDKSRISYVNRITGKHMLDANNYDLMINSGKMNQEDMVCLILDYMRYRGVYEQAEGEK